MKYQAMATAGTDEIFWLTKAKFLEFFDQHDFNFYREVKKVEPYYLNDWFYQNSGVNYFCVPTVLFSRGVTQFINGRHRTAVIFNEIDIIPMAFAERAAQSFAKSIGLMKLKNNEQFVLPKLPLKSLQV